VEIRLETLLKFVIAESNSIKLDRGEEMSDAARWMIALAFISLPSIAFGGYFLLSILKRQVGTENFTSEQRDYFRAGHAHAGVLVLLAIIAQLILDSSRFNDSITWALRIGLFAAPLLISGGFFGGAPRKQGDKPGVLIKLIPIGAIVLAISTLGVGVSLLIPSN
jgi:ABC-type Fe3+ transport system permease subunit